MKDLKFICAQPDDVYYTWQVHLWLENLKEIGHSDKAIVLVFTPSFREKNDKWDKIVALYPEVEFVFYRDDKNEISQRLGVYIPVLRPWCLMKYFYEHPEMKDKAVFYYDSDVLLTDKFDLDKFKDDDICYLSDTNSYINASYFDSKIKDVLPEKLEEYKSLDVLAQLTSLIGIDRATCEKNNKHSGGAQYLLKNIDGAFWEKVMKDCLIIRLYLQNINRQFFKNEDAGFQSWCADMWAVLWNLWLREQETKVVPELNFTWASDPIERLNTTTIFHNAGIVSTTMFNCPVFYKGKYHQGLDPMKDEHLMDVIENPTSKRFCTHFYASKLLELKNKYNLNY